MLINCKRVSQLLVVCSAPSVLCPLPADGPRGMQLLLLVVCKWDATRGYGVTQW